MSLVTLSHVCSHLQNASRARLGVTSVPSTNQVLMLMLALQKSGFISSVSRGGPQPPRGLLTATSMPHATTEEDIQEATVTQANIASRRLWLGLKYWNGEPVLSSLKMESTPKKRSTIKLDGLRRVVSGRDAEFIQGIRTPGECLYMLTDLGLLEAREAVERRIGGLVLCRVL